MTQTELDQSYTDFCHALGAVGEDRAMAALCRFALLSMLAIDDAAKIEEMTRRAFAPMP